MLPRNQAKLICKDLSSNLVLISIFWLIKYKQPKISVGILLISSALYALPPPLGINPAQRWKSTLNEHYHSRALCGSMWVKQVDGKTFQGSGRVWTLLRTAYWRPMQSDPLEYWPLEWAQPSGAMKMAWSVLQHWLLAIRSKLLLFICWRWHFPMKLDFSIDVLSQHMSLKHFLAPPQRKISRLNLWLVPFWLDFENTKAFFEFLFVSTFNKK